MPARNPRGVRPRGRARPARVRRLPVTAAAAQGRKTSPRRDQISVRLWRVQQRAFGGDHAAGRRDRLASPRRDGRSPGAAQRAAPPPGVKGSGREALYLPRGRPPRAGRQRNQIGLGSRDRAMGTPRPRRRSTTVRGEVAGPRPGAARGDRRPAAAVRPLQLGTEWIGPAVLALLLVATSSPTPGDRPAVERHSRDRHRADGRARRGGREPSGGADRRAGGRQQSVEQRDALLSSGALVWLNTIIAFTFVYWEVDGGGPAARVWRCELPRPGVPRST